MPPILIGHNDADIAITDSLVIVDSKQLLFSSNRDTVNASALSNTIPF